MDWVKLDCIECKGDIRTLGKWNNCISFSRVFDNKLIVRVFNMNIGNYEETFRIKATDKKYDNGDIICNKCVELIPKEKIQDDHNMLICGICKKNTRYDCSDIEFDTYISKNKLKRSTLVNMENPQSEFYTVSGYFSKYDDITHCISSRLVQQHDLYVKGEKRYLCDKCIDFLKQETPEEFFENSLEINKSKFWYI